MYFFEKVNKDEAYTISLETNEYITPEQWKRPRESVQLAKSVQFVKHFQLRKGSKITISVVDEQGNLYSRRNGQGYRVTEPRARFGQG